MTDSKRLLEISDLDRAADLMGRSFQNDPFTEYLIPNPEKRSRMLPKFFRLFLKTASGISKPTASAIRWPACQSGLFPIKEELTSPDSSVQVCLNSFSKVSLFPSSEPSRFLES